MGLFKKRAKGDDAAAKAKSSVGMMMAKPVWLIQGVDTNCFLAFGMRWRTLLRSGGKEVAAPLARNAKATHFIHLSQQVGYGIFTKQQTGDLYPAALLAAKINAGVALFALTLDSGKYWVCLVRNGFPTTADDLIDGSESDAVQRMRHTLELFPDEQITVYSDIRNSGIAGQQDFSLYDLFDVVRTGADQIMPMPKSGPRVPVPIMVVVIIGAGLLLGQKFWTDYQQSERLRKLAAMKSQDEDPQVAWAPVVRKFLAENAQADNASLTMVRASLSELPVMWNGWWLTGARCQAAEVVVDSKKTWTCTANYKRTPVGLVSSAMDKAVKQRMASSSVSFPNMGSMAVSWSFSVAAISLVLEQMKLPDQQTLMMISALQPMLPAMSNQPEFKMSPIELPAPKKSDGKAYPKPETVPDFFLGQVLIKGPMRSIDYVSTKLPPVDWLAIGIQFDEKASPASKGLTASALMAELDGRVLAKKGGIQ